MNRAAVVVNPTKVGDDARLRASVRRAMSAHGWSEPVWLETTAADPGRGQARSAVAAGVDLVIACGGDGTVTACADGLSGSGVPLAIVPMGTGNLLARNLGLSLGLDEALAIALGGVARALDAGRVNGALFVVMAGLGLDARMLRDTSEALKKRVGWLAYVVSVIRHLDDGPMRVFAAADGGRSIRMRVTALMVGNVGRLRGDLPLFPDARPDDGKLDAVAVVARGVRGWLVAIADILLRRTVRGRIYRIQFTELQLAVDREQPWEVDGDVMGWTRRLTVVAQPGGLLVQMPAESS